MKSLSDQTDQGLSAMEASIVDAIAAGARIADAAADHGLTNGQLTRLRTLKPALDQAVFSACARKQFDMVEKLDEIARTEPDVQRARLLCDNIRWTAGKLNPRVFGDRLDVTVEHKVDIGDALATARARALRPSRDLPPPIDVEFEALPSVAPAPAPDKQSEAPEFVPLVPDIFS